MTPDADIDGLVERLRRPSSEQLLGEWQPMREEAAALIEALRKERDDLLTRAQIQHSRILTSNHQYLARASAAEQKLVEIASLIGRPTPSDSGKILRIAALARSTSTNGG